MQATFVVMLRSFTSSLRNKPKIVMPMQICCLPFKIFLVCTTSLPASLSLLLSAELPNSLSKNITQDFTLTCSSLV